MTRNPTVADLTIPQEAVEAAVDVSYAGHQLPPGRARAVLVAAGPFIAAAALRQAAEDYVDGMTTGPEQRIALVFGAWLRRRADRLDRIGRRITDGH